MAFDGFVSSLRSRLVVEWCLDRYEPVQIGKFSFLVRPDFAPEIGRVVASEQAGWYSRAFDNGIRGENRDLGFLPGVWGASGPVVRSFVAEVSLPTKGLLGSPGNSWIVQIPDRSASSFGDVLLLEWDSAGSAPGSQGGIRVVLAFHDKDGCAALNITAKSFCNRMLIPVGTFGRWFAGDRLLNFTADFQPNSGQSFSSVQGGFTNLRASLGRFQ